MFGWGRFGHDTSPWAATTSRSLVVRAAVRGGARPTPLDGRRRALRPRSPHGSTACALLEGYVREESGMPLPGAQPFQRWHGAVSSVAAGLGRFGHARAVLDACMQACSRCAGLCQRIVILLRSLLCHRRHPAPARGVRKSGNRAPASRQRRQTGPARVAAQSGFGRLTRFVRAESGQSPALHFSRGQRSVPADEKF